MAIGDYTDMVVYNDEMMAGYFEAVDQAVAVFNENSNGCIQLIDEQNRGHYRKRAFFDTISGAVDRMPTTGSAADAAATAVKGTMDQEIGVKLWRRIGPIDNFQSAITVNFQDMREFSFLLGQYVGQELLKKQINDALTSAATAITNESTLHADYKSTSTYLTADTTALAKAMAKRGDKAQEIACWVMHSGPYHDLIQNQISATTGNIADAVVYGQSPGTLGRPVVVTDSSALQYTVASSSTASAISRYFILGLVPNAVKVFSQGEPSMVFDKVTGYAGGIIERLQGEASWVVQVKGFKWDTSNGGVNPTAATLATSTNWDLAVTSSKNAAGVSVEVE